MIRPAPGLTIEQQSEEVLLRACLWAEARGEPAVGRLAIAWVIKNRALHADSTMKAQILKPWQFSSFNQNDPNRELLLVAHKQDPGGWAAVDAICELFENRVTEDPTSGALNYYVEKMDKPPAWGRGYAGWMEHGVIGRHVFGIAS